MEATPENITMMQGFEWHVPADQKHWVRLEKQIPHLKEWGVDNIWLPPGCKASSNQSNGYDIYDFYDLGEFDQKGSIPTKWGTKEDLLQLAQTAQENGVGLYWDAVLNHKSGADRLEKCQVVEVDPKNRNWHVSGQYEIEAWVGFDFPGRGGKYSEMKYRGKHFTGVNYNNVNKKEAIYKIMGGRSDGWAETPDVDAENGNYDYLMGADLDHDDSEVKNDILAWGLWLAKEIPLKGIRFDAIKHYSAKFLSKFVDEMNKVRGGEWFFVGEFWKNSLPDMKNYLNRMDHKFSLFDVPLVYNFSKISHGNSEDLRRVFDGTLVQDNPIHSASAVTFVMNHDTQPGQSLATPIEGWFKPLAYALILLRSKGYPCVWYGDLYGVMGDHPFPFSCGGALPKLMLARKLYSYGEQADYFDFRTCVGWVRYGTQDRPFGCAVVMSNAGPGWKQMHVGKIHAGEVWTDVLNWQANQVVIGADGFGVFTCGQTSVSIWVNMAAEGREKFKRPFESNIY